jgi:hypothetical protein
MVWPKGKTYSNKHSNKTKKRISDSLKEYYRKNPSQSARNRNIVKAVTRWWEEHPEAKKSLSRTKKKRYRTNPEIKKKIDKAMTEWWKEHQNIKKQRSEQFKKFFLKNPDKFKKFLNAGKNPLKKHIKTEQGFKVRSKGEKQIANFLYNNSIPCLYESISLPITTKPFAGNICTPDFYIKQWNIFIEFYGGHPNSYKKKVLKNKIYKSHHIPVIAITPSELENLDYYLLKQGKQLSQTKTAKNFKIKKWIK